MEARFNRKPNGVSNMQTLHLGNHEQISRGLIETANGFLAITFTQSKMFKTRAAAVKWLAKRGVVVG